MSTCPEALSLSSLALFAPVGDSPLPNSLGAFSQAGTMARVSILDWAAPPLLDCSRTDPQLSSPVVLLILDSANPEKGEFRPKCPWVPLIKQKTAELMVIKQNIYTKEIPFSGKLCFIGK